MQLASISDNLKIWNFSQQEQKQSDGFPQANDKPIQSTLQLQASYRHPVEHFYSLAWNHTNEVIALGGREPKIHLIKSDTGAFLNSLNLSESKFKSLKVQAVDFSPNSRYLITSVHTPIQLWDLRTRSIDYLFTGHQHTVVSLLFHQQSGYFYSADELGQIWIWDIKKQTVHHKFMDLTASIDKSAPDNNYLSCMKLSSLAGNYLGSGYVDGSVKIWDASVGDVNTGNNVIRKQRLHSEKVTGIAFSPQNPDIFISVGLDEQLQLLDVHAKPTEVNLSVDVGQRLTSVSFHENGINCAVGTNEGNILVYDFRNTRYPVTQVLAHSPHPVSMLSFQIPVDPLRKERKEKKLKQLKAKAANESNENIQTAKEKKETKDQSTTQSPAMLSPKPSTIPTSIERKNFEGGLQPPTMITSIDLSDEKLQSQHNNSSIDATASFNYQNSLAQKLDSKLKSFEEEMKHHISKEFSVTAPVDRPTLQASSQQIQSTLNEVYPPSASTSSLLQSTKNRFPSSPTVPDRDSSATAVGESKDHIRSQINKSLLESNKMGAISTIASSSAATLPTANTTAVVLEDDPVSQSYEEREKEYLQQINQFYERNPTQKTKSAVSLPAQPPLQSTLPVQGDVFTIHDDFSSLRQAIRPVTAKELEESLDVLKYEIHCEIQEVIKEQVRQFTIAKEETTALIQELAKQLQELVKVNQELREENDYLRKIY